MATPKLALVQTCKMFPEQYDLIDAHGNRVAYYRLRHGYFSVECPDVGGTLVYEARPDGDGDFMDYERDGYLAAALAAVKKHYGWEDEDKAPDVAPDIKVGHKTPDEIKMLMANHKSYTFSLDGLMRDALALIQQLEAERDAMMRYLHSMGCDTCLYEDFDGSEPPCINCTATHDQWQWEGVQLEGVQKEDDHA